MSESWIERWQEGRTGWHQPEGNRSLKMHWSASGRRVLVPLCGKTPDMLWLAEHGNAVVGVEVSPIAVSGFFADHGLAFSVREGDVPAYVAETVPITIYCGDYFAVSGLDCDAHYDRGALVAMPALQRPAYVEQTRSLLTPGCEQLVITLEYDQDVVAGPPFAVPAAEVLDYWPDLERVDAYDDLADGPPKFLDAGLDKLTEVVWRTR